MIGLGVRVRIRSLKSAKHPGTIEKRRGRQPVPYIADDQSGSKWRSGCLILPHEHFKRVCHLMNCVWRLDCKLLGQIAIEDRFPTTGELLQVLPYAFR